MTPIDAITLLALYDKRYSLFTHDFRYDVDNLIKNGYLTWESCSMVRFTEKGLAKIKNMLKGE